MTFIVDGINAQVGIASYGPEVAQHIVTESLIQTIGNPQRPTSLYKPLIGRKRSSF